MGFFSNLSNLFNKKTNSKKQKSKPKPNNIWLYYVKFIPNGSTHFTEDRVYASNLAHAKEQIEAAYPLMREFSVTSKTKQN